MGYSTAEKFDIIRLYYSNNRKPSTTRNEYHRIFPNRFLPSKSTIKYVVKQFEETRSLERKKRTLLRDEQLDLNVLLFFEGRHFNYLHY